MKYTNTILIVDDERLGRETLKMLLVNQNYHLVFANDGAEALQKAAEFVPDLILLDVMMPDMDGFEVCQRLRANTLLAEVPIILVTALDDRDSRLRGIEAGADDFVTKPFDRAELRTRVRTITRLNRFRRLLAERSKFEWVVDHAEDGYLVINNAGEILYANHKARLYLNLPTSPSTSPYEPVTRTFQELIKEQYRREPEAAWLQLTRLDSKQHEAAEESPPAGSTPFYLVRPESPTAPAFWLQVDLLQVKLAPDSGADWMIRLRDVTNQMNIQRSQWQFQALISHKMRTPLIHMLSGMEVMASYGHELSPDEIVQLARNAVQSATRLRDEINEILQHSTISTTFKQSSDQAFHLWQFQPIITEICQELDLAQVTVSLEQGLEQDATPFSISHPALKLILREVLENAKKFHPGGAPVITINISRSHLNEIRLQVTDDGLTLSPEQLARVWTPYYQGEKYFTGEAAGMGLGLSMVASTIWSAGGTCRMYNRASGPGVTVDLVLPLDHTSEKK